MSRRKLLQGSLVMGSNSQTAVFNPNTKADAHPFSERRTPKSSPEVTVSRSQYAFSPKKPSAYIDQDIISSDDCDTKAEDKDNSVVVVDALYQRVDPGSAEVNVKQTIGVSPYKVVCHSPRAVKDSLKLTGDMASASTIPVDDMKSLSLGRHLRAGVDESDDDEPAQTTPRKHPPTQIPEIAASSDSSALSTDEPSSMAEVSAHSKLVTKKSVKDEPSVTKSKKNGRVVASRLMETTASRRAKTIGLSQQESYRSMLQKSRTRARYLNESALSHARQDKATPKNQRKTRRQASTPENSSIAPNESFDVSALLPNKTLTGHRVFNETDSFHTVNNVTRGVHSATKHQPTGKTKKAVFSLTDNITQDGLDVLYARYLQWLFLSSKAQTSIKREEQEALDQLERLWLENRKMKQKLSHLDQEFDRLQHLTDLDEILDLQRSMLGPVIHELPQLDCYYKDMADALATTQHELKTSGVDIPVDKDEQLEFEDALMSALEESEQLLAQIASHTRRNTSTTSEYAQAIDTLASTVSDQDKDLSRCRELVRVAQTLSNQENSMKIQEIEFSQL